MDLLFIDPVSQINCDNYSDSYVLLFVGVIAIVTGGLYLGYHLSKSPIDVFADGYRKQRKISSARHTFLILLLQILKTWRPITTIVVIVLFDLVIIYNAVNMAIALVQSGCI